MSHHYGFDNSYDKLAMNYFVIREVYRYMAIFIDDIIDAMPKFYDYLNTNENDYNDLATKGYCECKNKARPLLIECGFSDTFFRSDSPTTIEMSDNLFNMTYKYLFKNNNDIQFEDYTNFLRAEIRSIYNPDNTLLVVSVRRLISRITALPRNTIDEFIKSEIQENKEPKLKATQQVNRGNLSAKEIRAINYLVIREVYKHMAYNDKIKKPMERFYNYLHISDKGYDNLVKEGNCSKIVNPILIECGFSDTFFSRVSPVLINMSDSLYSNIFNIKNFKECLKTEIGTIINSDNKLLAEPVRELIFKIQAFTEYVDDDFIDILDDFEYKSNSHIKRKEFIDEIVGTYKKYAAIKENAQNSDQ